MGGKIAGPGSGVVISVRRQASLVTKGGGGAGQIARPVLSCFALIRSVFIALPSCCSSMGCGAET